MAKIPVSKYPNQAGYLQFDTNTNEVEVFSDGKFKAVTENNEYFNIYKNSTLLYESTTNFDDGPLLTDISTMRQYLVVRRTTSHGPAPSKIVKIDLSTKQETILIDGTTSNSDYRDGFIAYHNNIPYYFMENGDTINTAEIKSFIVLNPLTGEIIKEDNGVFRVPYSYIIINNELYFIGNSVPASDNYAYIIKYSFDTNEFTYLNTFTLPTLESEFALGKINGKFFAISRTYDIPDIPFTLRLFNDDWTVKKIIRLDLGYPIGTTTPYIFRKGNKLLFTYISRSGSNQTPGNLFTYEITEKDDNFNFELKNIFLAVLPEDVYYTSISDYIYPTGYQFPTILPFSKKGAILVEDRRTTPTYKTRVYQLDYDNDISVDYSNF